MKSLIPVELIEKKILLIRGHKVMLDSDLAELYGVPTKAFNQAVKRNRERFPDDFMFQLAKDEKDEVVTNCDHLKLLKFSPNLPFAFTNHRLNYMGPRRLASHCRKLEINYSELTGIRQKAVIKTRALFMTHMIIERE